MIQNLSLKNFTAFRDLDIEFSPKINVIIGENGTGKTHLLKAAYALCSAVDPEKKPAVLNKDELCGAIATTLVDVFHPDTRKLGRLVNRSAEADAEMSFKSDGGHQIKCNFGSRATSLVKINEDLDYQRYSYMPVYIPAKEVLSFYRGMTPKADRETLEQLFDSTYLNLRDQLARAPAESVAALLEKDPRLGTVYPKISNAIGGQYSLRDDSIHFTAGRFDEIRDSGQYKMGDRVSTLFSVMAKDAVDPISTSMTAEGFRKIGALQMLLLNRSVHPGIRGPLFWDEPETNMNPKLMRTLVDALLNLSRNGQQIILATHDYVLLKWLDLLMDKGKEDHIRYHSLYRDGEAGQVRLDSADDYRALSSNSIANTFSDLYDAEIDRALGAPKE
jgi:predicted ATPase